MNRKEEYNFGLFQWEACKGCEYEENCKYDGQCWNCPFTDEILEDYKREEEEN